MAVKSITWDIELSCRMLCLIKGGTLRGQLVNQEITLSGALSQVVALARTHRHWQLLPSEHHFTPCRMSYAGCVLLSMTIASTLINLLLARCLHWTLTIPNWRLIFVWRTVKTHNPPDDEINTAGRAGALIQIYSSFLWLADLFINKTSH